VRLTRRQLLKRAAAWGAAPLALGIYGREIEVYWLDDHEVPIVMPNLPPGFNGFRIAQLTDLHAYNNVPMSYLERVVRTTNEHHPDLVAITGDFTTHSMEWVGPVCDVLSDLKAPVVCSFGNHDYDASSAYPGIPMRIARELETRLSALGFTVLRNASARITRGQDVLHLVGLEDIHCGRFNPAKAYAGVPREEAIVTLSHNPDSVPFIDGYCCGLILSGHTHGGQVRIPFLGAPVLPVSDRSHDMGLFKLKWSQLYVSRGIGHLMKVRFCCRPELPVFVLSNSANGANGVITTT
jgi:uncharacterized protein